VGMESRGGRSGQERRPLTLDLVARAELSLNYLGRMVDLRRECEPYSLVYLQRDPPAALHDSRDFALTGLYLDAFILARQMTDSDAHREIECRLRGLLLSLPNKEDGLYWRPETPWSEHEVNILDHAAILTGLVTWYLESRDPEVADRIEGILQALWRLSAQADDFCYFPSDRYRADGWDLSRPRLGTWLAEDSSHVAGQLILSIVRYYEETGSEAALRLVRGLANFLLHHSGAFEKGGGWYGHFHYRVATIAGLMRYAKVSDDLDLFSWCRRMYDYAVTQGTRFGWFPELLAQHSGDTSRTCETCAIVEMIHGAVLLAESGEAQYWDLVERYVRNHLTEAQLREIDWVKAIRRAEDTDRSTFEEVPERALGGFASWSLPNDFIGPKHYPDRLLDRCSELSDATMMSCCGATGLRGLYHAWSHAVVKEKEVVRVNLTINRSTPWVEVIDSQPYEGRVDILIYDAPTLLLRVPERVRALPVRLTVDGVQTHQHWEGSYLKLTGLRRWQIVSLQYPLRETTERVRVGGREYRVRWKGDTVVGISPVGKVYPLYQRSKMRSRHAPRALRPPRPSRMPSLRW